MKGVMFTPNQKQEKVSGANCLVIPAYIGIFLPFAAMTISTRERAGFRYVSGYNCHSKSLQVWILGIGKYKGMMKTSSGDNQFEEADGRSVDETRALMTAV